MHFVDFARMHGVIIDRLIVDGRTHRVPTVDHPRQKHGAYLFDGETGYVQAWDQSDDAVAYRPERRPDAPFVRRAPRFDDEMRYAEAAQQAAKIVSTSEPGRHAYLARKGFGEHLGLVDREGRLVVPMRDCVDYRKVNSVQWINEQGEKKFMPGGKAKGSIFVLGSGQEAWLCEGYATGLSVQRALKSLFRQARVVVCFSANNLVHVAQSMKGRVVADNDASQTGEKAARATQMQWVMPSVVGWDANDLEAKEGTRALAGLLRTVI